MLARHEDSQAELRRGRRARTPEMTIRDHAVLCSVALGYSQSEVARAFRMHRQHVGILVSRARGWDYRKGPIEPIAQW
jgi:DNA-binding CsgD family transcriptional regulator